MKMTARDARGRTAGEKDSDGRTYSYVMPIRTWSANDKSQKQMLVPGWSVTTKESISRGVLKSTRSVSDWFLFHSHSKTCLSRVKEWHLFTVRWETLGRTEAAEARRWRLSLEWSKTCVIRSLLNKITCQYLKNIRSYCTKKRPELQRLTILSLGTRKWK